MAAWPRHDMAAAGGFLVSPSPSPPRHLACLVLLSFLAWGMFWHFSGGAGFSFMPSWTFHRGSSIHSAARQQAWWWIPDRPGQAVNEFSERDLQVSDHRSFVAWWWLIFLWCPISRLVSEWEYVACLLGRQWPPVSAGRSLMPLAFVLWPVSPVLSAWHGLASF